VEIARVYEAAETGPALRVLVDRLWPRGLSRSEASFDKWMKSVAPSSDLRKWYGHRAERFDEFGDRYRAELAQSLASEDVDELRHLAEDTGLVLLTATKDLALSHAIVLSGVIMGE
jgi:uncharacterized protein YeaO (DUF488 family)